MEKENVKVEAIYDAKEGNNQDYKTLQLRTEWMEKNFLNDLLGSDGFKRTKVAFQSVKNSVIEAKGIEVGTDLGAAIGADLRIVHTESLEDGPGFQALMVIGEDGKPTDQPVTSGGKQIYFKRELGEAGQADTTLSRDKAAVEASAPIESEEEAA